jgi:zinc transport system ATP-binding protein
MRLIEAEGLAVRLGGHDVLHDVNLRLDRGEIVTIVGPNGSGKSTLLRTLIGAQRPTRGRILRAPGLRIGYVPQRLHIDPTLPMSVARFLNLPRRRPAAALRSALEGAGLPDLGPRQMADQPGSAAFYRRIAEVRREMGCAVLMVSHELHVVMSASDRVICLNGHVCCEGRPEIVAQAEEYRALFGTGTEGALALYRHEHGHSHDNDHPQSHEAAE